LKSALYSNMMRATEELKSIVSSLSTRTLVSRCAAYITFDERKKTSQVQLSSPFKEIYFLLEIMLATEEPSPEAEVELTEGTWQRLASLLEEVIQQYGLMYWDAPDTQPDAIEDWERITSVAMPVFLDYHNTPTLASAQQLREKAIGLLAPFDDAIEEGHGLTASQAVAAVDTLQAVLQENLDSLVATTGDMLALQKHACRPPFDVKRIQEEAKSPENVALATKYFRLLNDAFVVRRDQIAAAFDSEVANAFWKLFSSRRQEVADPKLYFTDFYRSEKAPLFEIEDGVACCPSINAVYAAVLDRLTCSMLSNGERVEAFLRHRGRYLEEQTADALARVIGPGATVWPGLYETRDLHHEHDLVVVVGRTVLVVECKSTPLREPLRDQGRAFPRLKRDFEKTIQEGSDQAWRIRTALFHERREFPLFDKTRDLVLTLRPDDVDEVFEIVVTADRYGALATDLTMLLERSENHPSPWAVNLWDLDELTRRWRPLGQSPESFFEYLRTRREVHGLVFSEDEFCFAGYFIHHGPWQPGLAGQADRVFLNPSYGSIFDDAYQAEMRGEQLPIPKRQPPVMMDPRTDEFVHMGPATPQVRRKGRKTGRNAPCPCGSGKKYKRCCLG